MRKNKIYKNVRKPLCVFCSVALGAMVALGVGGLTKDVVADVGDNSTLTTFLEHTYAVGDTVTLPFYEFNVGNGEVEADRVIRFPSGQAYVGDTFTLTEMGEYTLSYSAQIGGKYYEKEETFDVEEKMFSIDGENSSMCFGAVAENTQYTSNTKEGLIVNLAPDESFRFNKIIDLKEYSATEEFISLSVLPNQLGVADVYEIYVTLTDVYDPDNYVTLKLGKAGDGSPTQGAYFERITYVTAYASCGQTSQGLKAKDDGAFEYEGQRYTLHYNNRYGTEAATFSLSGYSYNSKLTPALYLDETQVGNQSLELCFDYETKRPYVKANGGASKMIIDLDDPIFHTAKYVWGGFTDGLCKVSVSASRYTGTSCRILINEIGGETTVENTAFYDDEAPVITVDSRELDAVSDVRTGKWVKIPKAFAKDLYTGDCAVSTKVYLNYGMSTQAAVDVVDGAFKPSVARTYTIVYTATDRCGNVAYKTYEVKAVRSNDEISLDFGSPTSSVAVGQEIVLGKPNVSNAVGNWYATISTEKNGVREEFMRVDYANVDEQDYTWIPMSAGTYKIVYSYNDYISSGEVEYQVTVTKDGSKILVGDAVLPKYIIKGATYQTPTFDGYDFVNGEAVPCMADVYVSGSEQYSATDKVTGETFKVTTDNCYITFVLGSQSRTYTIPVVDVNYGKTPLKIYNYFAGYETVSPAADGVTYTVGNDNGVYALDFINAVGAFDCILKFTIPTEATYGGVDVLLTDSVDNTQQLKFAFSNGADGNLKFSVNGGIAYDCYMAYENATVNFAYNDTARTVKVDTSSYDVTTGLDGSEWTGFSSGKVYVTLVMKDVTDAPQLKVTNVGNQAIYEYIRGSQNYTTDSILPQMTTPTLKGRFLKNDEVQIVPFEYCDVLSPYTKVTMTVSGPNGAPITSVDGILLKDITDVSREYTIKLSTIGSYMVEYHGYDTSKENVENCNKLNYAYQIIVESNQGPVVVIGNYSRTVTCGTSVTLASISVRDDYSPASACTVRKFVHDAAGIVKEVKGNTYTPEVKGTYRVSYYVSDEEGNVTIETYTFIAV